MKANVISLRTRKPLEDSVVCPAQFYKFMGNPAAAVRDEAFMQKAAAFQGVRDCLIAVDRNQLSANQAEELISYLIRTYLGLH